MRHEQHSTHVKQDQTARPTGETLRGSSMVHSDGTRGLGGERAVRRPKTVLSASGIAFAYRVHVLGSMQCYNRPFGSPTMCASSLVPYGGIFCMPQRAWRGKLMIPAVMFRYMMNYGAFALVKPVGLMLKSHRKTRPGSPCWIGTAMVYELSLRAAASTFCLKPAAEQNRKLADMVPSSGCVTDFEFRGISVLDLMNCCSGGSL